MAADVAFVRRVELRDRKQVGCTDDIRDVLRGAEVVPAPLRVLELLAMTTIGHNCDGLDNYFVDENDNCSRHEPRELENIASSGLGELHSVAFYAEIGR